MHITYTQLEKQLMEKYYDKFVHYSPIGKPELYGRLERIVIDDVKNPPIVILIIDGQRFEEELDEYESLLKLI